MINNVFYVDKIKRIVREPSMIFVVICSFLLLTSCSKGGDDDAGKNTSITNKGEGNRLKVLILGIDGFEPSIFDKLLDSGDLPNLARIIKSGSRGRVRTEFILSSPVIWTSIATGVVPEKHGITNFTIGGKPVNSSSRKAPAFWNIFPMYGIRGATLAWWATWPAEKNAGIMIGSRVFWKDRPNKVYPPQIIDTDKYAMNDFIDDYGFLPRFTHYPYNPDYKKGFNSESSEYILNKLIRQRLVKIYYRDMIYTDIAMEIEGKKHPDVMAVYLQGVDHVSHAFWKYMDPKPFRQAGFIVNENDVKQLGNIIPEYYRYTDELVGKLLENCDENTYIFVLADHGFEADPSLLVNYKSLGLSGNHRSETAFFLSGPDIVKHQNFADVTPQHQADFLPTLFYLLDIPLSKDFAGKPQKQYFSKKFRKKQRVRYVETYQDAYRVRGAVSSENEQKILNDLRGLGYIK